MRVANCKVCGYRWETKALYNQSVMCSKCRATSRHIIVKNTPQHDVIPDFSDLLDDPTIYECEWCGKQLPRNRMMHHVAQHAYNCKLDTWEDDAFVVRTKED